MAALVVSFETIEHLRDDRSFLEEMSRILAVDGTFICSTPNRRLFNPGGSLADPPYNPHHVREYDHEEFKELLTRTSRNQTG